MEQRRLTGLLAALASRKSADNCPEGSEKDDYCSKAPVEREFWMPLGELHVVRRPTWY